MQVDNKEIERQLNSPENFCNSVHFKKLENGGRKAGCQNIPPLVRDLIGVTAAIDSTASVAKAFDVSPSTVERTKEGNIGNDRFDPELKDKVENKRAEVRDKALDRIAGLFATSLSDSALGTLKPLEAVNAAKGLAEVVERVSEKAAAGAPQTNFVVFAPRIKEESEYPAIDITPDHKKEGDS